MNHEAASADVIVRDSGTVRQIGSLFTSESIRSTQRHGTSTVERVSSFDELDHLTPLSGALVENQKLNTEALRDDIGETRKSATQVQRLSSKSRFTFQPLESWVGRVDVVDHANDVFTATVFSGSQSVAEVGEFELAELSDDDISLVAPGAIFYWTVGYQVMRSRQRITASTIRFKRRAAPPQLATKRL